MYSVFFTALQAVMLLAVQLQITALCQFCQSAARTFVTIQHTVVF